MALPGNMSLVWVRGTFLNLDGSAMTGRITFSANVIGGALVNPTAKRIIGASPFSGTLDANTGYFQVQLPATNDPDVTPVGFTYSVVEPTGRKYSITVPFDAPALDSPGDPLHGQQVIELSDIVPAPGASGGTAQLLRGRGVASMDVDGTNHLVVTYSDATTEDLGVLPGGALANMDDLDTTGAAVGQVPAVFDVSPLGFGLSSPPLDVTLFGASPAATPAVNQAAFVAALAAAVGQGRPVYVPGASSPYQINDFVDIATAGVHVFGDGYRSHIQQTVAPHGCFLVTATDVTIEGLRFSSSAGRDLSAIVTDATDLQGDGRYLSNDYSGIRFTQTAHRATFRNISGSGMHCVIAQDGPVTAGVYTDGVVIEGVECDDVCFGVLVGGLRDARISRIRGNYSLTPGIGKPPHLIYVAEPTVAPYNRNLQMSDIEAWDGETGAAIKVAGVIGGAVQGVSARNCRGVLDLLRLTDVNFTHVVSIDDNGSAVDPGPIKASIMVEECTRTSVRSGKVVFANIDHAEGLQTTALSTDCVLENIEVTTNFSVTQANEHFTAVRIYGTRNSYRNIFVENIGADRGSAFLVANATDCRIVDPIVRGPIRYGFFSRTTAAGTVVDYDPAQLDQTYSGALEQFLEAGAAAPTMQVRGTSKPFTAVNQYFFTTSPGAVGSSVALGVGAVRLVPWLVERTITIDRLGVEVLTAGEAGSLFRIVIYNDSGACLPASLVVDGGTVATDTTGSKEVTVNVTLQAGVYWIGGAVQNVVTTQPTMRTVSAAGGFIPPVPLRQGSTMPTGGQQVIGMSSSSTITGVAPASWPGSNGSGSAVRVFARRSA